MKKFVLIASTLLFTLCSTPTKKSMSVSGKVDGLRKGTLYLQKMVDTLLVTVDSVAISGDQAFRLGDDIESPEFYFLSLDKKDGDSLTDKILFFGSEGEIKINTLLRTFSSSAKVEGSPEHNLWKEYESMMRKFYNKRLENFNAFNDKSSGLSSQELYETLEQKNASLEKRRNLFALNFAMNNSDKAVSAYIGTYEIPNVAPLFLDSLYNNLTAEVKVSKYGLAFKQQLDSLSR
ncbi:MAG: DUF4369 domain-containing protein [Flavobacteriaceae bacterium]